MRCAVHSKSGVAPGTPAFFYPGCVMCEDKRARGLVRGDEGPLNQRNASDVLRARTWARQSRVWAAARKAVAK